MKRTKRLQTIISLLEMETSVTCGNLAYRVNENNQSVYVFETRNSKCFYSTCIIGHYADLFSSYLDYNEESKQVELKIY